MREVRHGPARLLVADDNKVNRLLLARRLELQGHAVAMAGNGRVALEMLRRERFDLLLLDMEMPEMNGFEVLAHLRQSGSLAQVPFIFLTASADRDSIARGIALGAADYVTKPFDLTQLAALVRRRLGETGHGFPPARE